MNIGQGNFPIIQGQNANPLMRGLSQGLMQYQQFQENQKRKALMPFLVPTAQAALDSSQLQNQAAQMNNRWIDPKAMSQLNLQGAQAGNLNAEAQKTRFILQNPGFMGGDASKELSGLQALGIIPRQQQSAGSQVGLASQLQLGANGPQDSQGSNQAQQFQANSKGILSGTQGEPFNSGNPALDAILNKSYAKPAYETKMNDAFNYTHAPVEAKSYMIAQLAGMGIDPSRSVAMLSQGKTIPQIAQENGFDPNNLPQPDFLPSKGVTDQLKKRQAALAESKVIDKFVSDGLGPYSRTIAGMSPKQIGEALTGQNPEGQSNFLAARALAPESSNIRLMLAQGQPGISAVQDIMKKSMQDVSAYQGLVSPEVYKQTQDKILSKLEEAFGEAEKTYQIGNRNKQADDSSQKQSTPKVGEIDGGYKYLGGDPGNPKSWSKA
jgi:hypothetical protein